MGYALVVLAMLLWSGNAVVGRVATGVDVPPIGLNFWRWTVALLILAPFALARLRAQWEIFRTHWWLWCAFGIVSIAGFNSALYIGLRHTTVIQGALISTSLPIFVLLGARLFLAQRITGRQVAGAVISIAGVALIILRGDPTVVTSLVMNVGDMWILAAIVMWAAQTILIRFLPREMDLIAFQIMAFVAGLAVLAPLYARETLAGQPMPLTADALILIGYAGVLASVFAYTFWNLGVQKIGPKTAGYFGNLYPVFGAALGIILLGEPFRWYHAVGGLVTLGGIYLATVAPAVPAREADARR